MKNVSDCRDSKILCLGCLLILNLPHSNALFMLSGRRLSVHICKSKAKTSRVLVLQHWVFCVLRMPTLGKNLSTVLIHCTKNHCTGLTHFYGLMPCESTIWRRDLPDLWCHSWWVTGTAWIHTAHFGGVSTTASCYLSQSKAKSQL